MKRRKGYFSISAVAKMFSVHQQTIRLYEKEGLISPKRSEGNTRLFSEEDVDRLEEIIYLTHKMGVNLSGVEIILKLQKKIQKLQDEMNNLFNQTQGQLEEESANYRKQLVQGVKKLHEIKKSKAIPAVDLDDLDENIKEAETEEEYKAKAKHPSVNQKKRSLHPTKSKQMSIEDPDDDWKLEYDE